MQPLGLLVQVTILCALISLVASQGCYPGLSVSQTIRTSWSSNGQTSTLYDIIVTNGGTQATSAAQAPVFLIRTVDNSTLNIKESWNLVIYATTVSSQRVVSLFPGTVIAAGANNTSAGYIVSGAQTTIELLSDCPTNLTNSTTNTNSSACPGIIATQSLRTQLPGSLTPFLYDINVTNYRSTAVSFNQLPMFLIATENGSDLHLGQAWNLIVYASTVPSQVEVALAFNTTILAGSSYTGAGYTSNEMTTLHTFSC